MMATKPAAGARARVPSYCFLNANPNEIARWGLTTVDRSRWVSSWAIGWDLSAELAAGASLLEGAA